MYDDNSPILDFYPEKFEEDLNGKKQDWEAIVKIPFIDEKRLLKAMNGALFDTERGGGAEVVIVQPVTTGLARRSVIATKVASSALSLYSTRMRLRHSRHHTRECSRT